MRLFFSLWRVDNLNSGLILQNPLKLELNILKFCFSIKLFSRLKKQRLIWRTQFLRIMKHKNCHKTCCKQKIKTIWPQQTLKYKIGLEEAPFSAWYCDEAIGMFYFLFAWLHIAANLKLIKLLTLYNQMHNAPVAIKVWKVV